MTETTVEVTDALTTGAGVEIDPLTVYVVVTPETVPVVSDLEARTPDATENAETLDVADDDADDVVDDVSDEVAAPDDVDEDGGNGAGFLGGETSLLNALSTCWPAAATADGDDDNTVDDDVTTMLTDVKAVVAGTDSSADGISGVEMAAEPEATNVVEFFSVGVEVDGSLSDLSVFADFFDDKSGAGN